MPTFAVDEDAYESVGDLIFGAVERLALTSSIDAGDAEDLARAVKRAYRSLKSNKPEKPKPPPSRKVPPKVLDSPSVVDVTTPRGTDSGDEELSIETAIRTAHRLRRAADESFNAGDTVTARELRSRSVEMSRRARELRTESLRRLRRSSRSDSRLDEEWAGLEQAIAASLEDKESIEEARMRLQRALAQWGFVERPVPGDNNCQFHAVRDQLLLQDVGFNPEKVTAQKLRGIAVQYLRENAERYVDAEDAPGERTRLRSAIGYGRHTGKDWDRYLDEMSKHGETWGDEATLLALSCYLHAEIVVVSNVSEGSIRTVSPSSWDIPVESRIFLGHYHEFHYISCGFGEQGANGSTSAASRPGGEEKSATKSLEERANAFKRMKDSIRDTIGV